MALDTPLWLQNASGYSAADMRKIIGIMYPATCVTSFAGLQVASTGGAGNQTVNINPGHAVIRPNNASNDRAGESAYLASYTNGGNVTNVGMPTAPLTNSRYDLVTIKIEDSMISGSANDAVPVIVSGSEAASPTVPATPDFSIALAKVLRAVGDNTIAAADITDVRALGSPGELYAYKTADESVTSSTTQQNDDQLFLTIPQAYANQTPQTWDIEGTIYLVGGTTGDIDVSFASLTGLTIGYQGLSIGQTGEIGSINAPQGAGASGFSFGTSSNISVLKIYGYFQSASSGGLVQFKFAQHISDATATTVKAGSRIVARRR